MASQRNLKSAILSFEIIESSVTKIVKLIENCRNIRMLILEIMEMLYQLLSSNLKTSNYLENQFEETVVKNICRKGSYRFQKSSLQNVKSCAEYFKNGARKFQQRRYMHKFPKSCLRIFFNKKRAQTGQLKLISNTNFFILSLTVIVT